MRNYKPDKNEEKSEKVLSFLRFLSGLASHLFALFFFVFTCYISNPGSSLFSWHPITMSLGISIFMMEAILIFSPESSLFVSSSRKSKVKAHWIMQSLSIACIWIGFIAIVLNKFLRGKAHFKTWHGTLGLITVLYVSLQAGVGILLMYPATAKRWNWKLVQLKVYHATFGLVGFVLASVTMIVSLHSNFVTKQLDGFAWWACVLAVSWCALFVMNQVSNTYTRHITRHSLVPL